MLGDNGLSMFYKDFKGISERIRFTRPWLTAVRYPTDYIKPAINSAISPKLKISPEYVFGYRTKGCSSNIKYLNRDVIVFITGTLVVFQNIKSNKQRYFAEHKTAHR